MERGDICKWYGNLIVLIDEIKNKFLDDHGNELIVDCLSEIEETTFKERQIFCHSLMENTYYNIRACSKGILEITKPIFKKTVE
jgi:hypothetical protein